MPLPQFSGCFPVSPVATLSSFFFTPVDAFRTAGTKVEDRIKQIIQVALYSVDSTTILDLSIQKSTDRRKEHKKAETTVQPYHFPCDMVVRIREAIVITRRWSKRVFILP